MPNGPLFVRITDPDKTTRIDRYPVLFFFTARLHHDGNKEKYNMPCQQSQ